MAKCAKCHKSGIFFRVEKTGFCRDCERIKKLEKEEELLRVRLNELKEKLVSTSDNLQQIVAKRESIFKKISDTAKQSALASVATQLGEGRARLSAVSAEVEAAGVRLEALASDEQKLNKSIGLAANKLKRVQTVFKALQFSVARHQAGDSLDSTVLTDEAGREAEELLETTVKLKLHLMDVRELKKEFQQNEKVIAELLATYQSRYTTKANASIYKLMVIALEAELQNVLYNLAYAKLDKSISDVHTIIAKYQKIASDGNQNIAPTIAKFIGEIEYLFIQAVKIEHEYYIQKERVKEEQRMLREQMRQEAAERKILEEQRKKVEQEEAKYKAEIEQISLLLSQASDPTRIEQLQERADKIQNQLNDVEKKKDSIINLQNGKAGYIYVISNLGSFGDKVFKVGMTRRLNPQERVDELGDASVPFRFDVHSFIFSNSAPALESALHKRLHNQRVNKVNLRKEFFVCTIDELESLVYELEPTAEFNRTMLAEQFFQSGTIDFIPEEFTSEMSYDSEELEEEMA